MTILLHWFDAFAPAQYGTVFQYRDAAGIMRSAMAGQAFEYFFLHPGFYQKDTPRINPTFCKVIRG